MPGMAISPEQAEKNIRNLFKSMAIPGVAEGYLDPVDGSVDELEKMVWDADPSMQQSMTSAINGNISALNGKIVRLVLEKR